MKPHCLAPPFTESIASRAPRSAGHPSATAWARDQSHSSNADDRQSRTGSDAQLHWIVSDGLKMSGMPSFASRLSAGDRCAIVAFLRRLQRLSPSEYQCWPRRPPVSPSVGEPPATTAPGVSEPKATPREGERCCTMAAPPVTLSRSERSHCRATADSYADRQVIAVSLVNVPGESHRLDLGSAEASNRIRVCRMSACANDQNIRTN
jgi:hypothetical protein